MSDRAWSEHPIVKLVTGDLQAALNETFEQTDGFSPAPDLPTPIEADGYTVVAWEYRGRERLNHLARKEFLAGRRDVVVRGVTVVNTSEKEPLFHRYIDWAGVYDQLGMVPGRPSVGVAQAATIGFDDDHSILVPTSGGKPQPES
jgi:hypothetical protein